jgi:hypothetical protein
VDGFPVTEGQGIRVRITVDEAEGLGLVLGEQVQVEWASHEPAVYLLCAAVESPPVVWLGFRPLKSRVAG